MSNYIDAFVFPIHKKHVEQYQKVSETIVDVWKEHGALSYHEYVVEDPHLEGTRSFIDAANANEDEAVIFGWVVFESKETRDLANKRVPADPRMEKLIAPLMDPSDVIFDASRMVYGGFKVLV